jgi:hypothetical protein
MADAVCSVCLDFVVVIHRCVGHKGPPTLSLGGPAAKKVQPRLSSIFGFLLFALALKISRHMHPLTKQEPALVMGNQTQAPAAECAPFHGGALLYCRSNGRRIRQMLFSFR